ncbi:MAG: Asp-tRNA(Asn)/Glu-tRNA(Gln) amidotransferase subunit GatA, partial [Kiritimatiellae bacterium]|nr:Asp-tRNA(Asn)/Glu-tRNA(Gln) amidotransferase subunit GatA [Kiritimatiellia bacterium]
AVGGELCYAALGTDTGGSIRQPASFCNCVGVKPSYGRVSRFGVTAFASSLDQVGPLAKSVEDAAILLGAIAGHDEMDGTTPKDPVPDYAALLAGASLQGVRIGVVKEYAGIAGLDPEVKRITDEAIAKCTAAGAEIVEVSLPHAEYAMAVYYIIAPAEASANLARFDGVRYGHRSERSNDVFSLYTRSRAEGFGPEVKRRIIMGTYVLSSGYYDAYYGRAQKVRTLIRRDFEEAFSKVDAILTPCAPTPAFKLGELQDPLTMYLNDLFTIPSSLAGVCAASVPAGFTAARPDRPALPVGVQFICASFAESKLLQISKAFEETMK